MRSQVHNSAWVMPMAHFSTTLFSRNPKFLALTLSFIIHCLALQNPRDDFCRRYGHQSTVINDKLYIDGGWVNYNTFAQDHTDYSNYWLSFHDLNNLTQGTPEAWPQLNINLTKDRNVIPTVEGGVLWGDSLNGRFHLFGGAYTEGLPGDFHLFRYDIINDMWDDLGAPVTTVPMNITSYGAGVGISQTGEGYYYGGWVNNKSMQGWTSPPAMSSSLYKFEYDANKFVPANSPTDNLARAEGTMVWISAGDTGLLVYFGGIFDQGNGTTAAQPMNKILVYDPSTNAWFTQTATGEVPENRRRFCADVAWAPDRSSYNIYVWGGLSVPPPIVNVTAFNDLYLLTLPSFTWVKLFPDHHGNGTYQYGHYSATCNMVKSYSQMMVIGGSYPDSDMCDLASQYWAQHNLWTGTLGNEGDNVNDTYWALFNPNLTSNVVPDDVYNIVGGNKDGGATQLAPTAGYDQGNSPGLDTLLRRKPTFTRTPTRAFPAPTNSTIPTPTATTTPPSSKKLSTGAIVGIAIGCAAAAAIILTVWCIIGRRLYKKRREARRQSEMTQQSATHLGYRSPSVVTPQSPQGQWLSNPGSPIPPMGPPPTELEAAQQNMYNKPVEKPAE